MEGTGWLFYSDSGPVIVDFIRLQHVNTIIAFENA